MNILNLLSKIYNASALVLGRSTITTSPCCGIKHPHVHNHNMGMLSDKTWGCFAT